MTGITFSIAAFVTMEMQQAVTWSLASCGRRFGMDEEARDRISLLTDDHACFLTSEAILQVERYGLYTGTRLFIRH
jgi:hypothetical protein